ncbi:geraniol 8-hydroxylase-like [Citrus sinensis]|uniref:geraniol 8-hydroxylase-like n=1 Tax=Citrus sinensis TaxID=2711 RepID=UPI002277FD6A|nr:geraniol 8-hydroxylase-like [Citrus sinensis]
MAELLCSPEALSKARLEMEQTIGKGNPIEESDINRLPYLQAAVKETFRLHPAVFLITSSDESTWDNSHSFMPERFLRTDLNFKGQNFELILFGAGRRICPGSPLAIRMFHLMLGSLIRSFDWKLEDGVRLENMDMEEKFDLTLQKARPLRVVPVAI